MFTRLACNDPFAFVPVLSLVVVGIFFHRVVPCSPVILIHISTLSPVVSVSSALAPATLGVERMMVFIVQFIVLGYRVSITRSMESQKRSVRRSAVVCLQSPNRAHRLRGDEPVLWNFHCFRIVCPDCPSRVRHGRTWFGKEGVQVTA